MISKATQNVKAVKWLKIGAWVVGLAIFLFLGLFLFTNWLQNRLEKMVQKQSDGLYDLALYGLEVSPFIGNISLDSLSLKPDYELWQKQQADSKKVPRMLFDIQMGPVDARNVNMLAVLFNNGLEVKQLTLQQPDLLITSMRPDTTERQKEAYQTVTGLLKNLHIHNIAIDSARLRYRKYANSKTNLLSILKIDLTVNDFKLDSQSYHAKDRAYYARQIMMSADGMSYLLPDGQYRATLDSLHLDTDAQTFLATRLQLNPLGSAREMSAAKGKAVTSNTIKLRKLHITGLDYRAHFLHNSYLAQHISIEQPQLEVFKDRQTGQPEAKKPLPHELVRKIKASFLVDTINVENGYVRYSELAAKGSNRGHITFSSINAKLTNFTNLPEHISMQKPAVLRGSAMLMEKARLQLTLKIPLLNKNGYHTFKGTVSEMNPELLNPILVPMASIKVASGFVNRGEFAAELTENRADGTMTILYKNLEIELLNKGPGNEQGLGKEIVSEIADWVAIKDANPMEGEGVRTGNITVTHDPKKSVLNYWKNCLVSGILSSIGLQSMAKK